MRVATLLRKIFLVDLLKGMSLTFRYQDPKEIYTEQYPLQRPQVAERYRGLPRLNVNPETGKTLVHRVRPVREGVSGKSDCGGERTRSGNQAQGADQVHLRHQPLHVLRTVRRIVLNGCAGTDAGL